MTSGRNYAVDFLDKMLIDSYKTPPDDKMISYKGVLYPSVLCSAKIFQTLETFEFRKDDMILARYPKSGTNWTEKMLSQLRNFSEKEEEKKKRIEMENELALPPRIEFVDPDKLKRMAQLPSRRIIVTHLPPHLLSKSVFENKVKILLLIRNPKDTLVSYFHFYNNAPMYPDVSWDQFFTNFMNGQVGWGSYFDYVKEWDKCINEETVMPICYEELKENPVLGLKNIAKFFGFSVTEDEIQTAAEKHSFKAMKEEGLGTHGTFANIIFRKGVVGDWKSLFSEYQNQEMDRKFKESLAGTKLGTKMKYEVYCKV